MRNVVRTLCNYFLLRVVVSCATMQDMQSPITDYRKTNDQTLEALADVLGVDKSTIWRWERGRVPVDRLADVERATGIPRATLRPDVFGDAQ